MAPNDSQLGLVTLYSGPDPTIDIIAVHGLGSNAESTWAYRISADEGSERVRWLEDADMLPAQLPNARIMAFNYDSRWLYDATKQRHDLCANQLLTFLDNARREEPGSKYRPLLFIGHSFGGIVIEQALVNAALHEDFQHLALSTVGVVFLGTPFRGTAASKWGEYIASLGKSLGYGSEDQILKILREYSGVLTALLYDFSLWVNKALVKVICCFEQRESDYTKGARIGGVFPISCKEIIVGEHSACIDGHRKLPLPTDHFNINKYSGTEDPSYKAIYPILVQMSSTAVEKVRVRLHPRRIVYDNSGLDGEVLSCVQSLFATNPLDDLSMVRRSKGDRVQGTCEWILVQKEYTSWLAADTFQFLRLVGGPGIGKTMMSSFLINELQESVQRSPNAMFIYYLFDNKHEKRNSANNLLRGLLVQILRQRPSLFKHIRHDYLQMKDNLKTDFDALWRILLSILCDDEAGEVLIIVDAVDECETSRQTLLHALSTLARSKDKPKSKWLITCRPEPEIEEAFADSGTYIRADSGKVNADLAKYIEIKVAELSKTKRYPPKLKEEIEHAFKEKAGGTFLWVSLVLDDLAKTQLTSKVRAKLKDLPATLSEVYDRILEHIDSDNLEDARYILKWVTVARRPLKATELAMARAMASGDWDETVPSKDDLDEFMDGFRCCEPLLYYDESNETINLVHQSAKDYLLSEDLLNHPILSTYRVVADQAHFRVAQICWKFLTMKEFKHGALFFERNDYGKVVLITEAGYLPRAGALFQYAPLEYCEHTLSANKGFQNEDFWERDILCQASDLRDWLLLRASREGQEATIRLLLDKGANIEARDPDGRTPLHLASAMEQEAAISLLLDNGANIEARDARGWTPLHLASKRGQEAAIRLLTDKGADVAATDATGRMPLYSAIIMGHEAAIRLLIDAGADFEAADAGGRTLLHLASGVEQEAAISLLLDNGANIEARDARGWTPLHLASCRGQEAAIHLLLDKGAKIEARDARGWTPLHLAISIGDEAAIRLLLDKGAHIKARDAYGQTPLHLANLMGNEAAISLLLDNDANIEARNADGRTPLHSANLHEREAAFRPLLDKGAHIKARDADGRSAAIIGSRI